MSAEISRESSKDDVKFNTGGEVKGLWGLASAGGHLDGSVFTERMKEHGLTVEFDGEKWAAKGLDLYLVNKSEFAQKLSRSCTIGTVGAATPLTQETRQLVLQ